MAAVAALALGVASACGAGAHAAAAQTHTILIEGMRFTPETLAVQRGDRIVWRNQDLLPHTVTARAAFDSRSIAAGASWTYVARKTGTLPYVCSFHPAMRGALTVR